MEIKVFANFREICGGKKVDIEVYDNEPIENVLDRLIEKYPKMKEELFTEDKEIKPLVHVFINGKNVIHLEGLKSKVKTTDEIALFPPVAGG